MGARSGRDDVGKSGSPHGAGAINLGGLGVVVSGHIVASSRGRGQFGNRFDLESGHPSDPNEEAGGR